MGLEEVLRPLGEIFTGKAVGLSLRLVGSGKADLKTDLDIEVLLDETRIFTNRIGSLFLPFGRRWKWSPSIWFYSTGRLCS
jgi:hypothetical protein